MTPSEAGRWLLFWTITVALVGICIGAANKIGLLVAVLCAVLLILYVIYEV